MSFARCLFKLYVKYMYILYKQFMQKKYIAQLLQKPKSRVFSFNKTFSYSCAIMGFLIYLYDLALKSYS